MAYHHLRRHTKRTPLLVLLALLAIAAGGSYWYFVHNTAAAAPIPASIRSEVNFPLMYPSKLPNGFSIDKNSFSVKSGVVLFSANDANGTKIAFTVQPRPSTFAFDTFYKQGLSGTTTFDTPVGQAAIGQANGHPLGSLTTDQSWLLVSSASNKIQSNGLRLILQNVKSVDK